MTCVKVMFFRVLPVDATVVDVSVIAAVVNVTPVETTDTSVADAKVTATVDVVPAPASIQFSDLTPVPKVVLVTKTALVPALVPEFETLTVSNPAMVVDAGTANAEVADQATFKVSVVPAPPLMLSKLFKVRLVTLNVSLPAVLVVPAEPSIVPETSTPVVSVLNWCPKMFNKRKHLAYFDGQVFCVAPPFSDQRA